MMNFETFTTKNILIYFIVFLLLYGITMYSLGEFRILSNNPFEILKTNQWLQSSPLQFFLGYPFTKFFGYKASYMIIQISSVVLFLYNFRVYLKNNNLKLEKVFPVIILTPLLLILLNWFGKPDLLLLSGYLIILNNKKFIWCFFGLLIAVFSHPQIAFFYLLFLFILYHRRINIIVIILVYSIYFIYINVLGDSDGRADYIIDNIYRIVSSILTNPLSHIIFTLNWFWLIILMSYKKIPKEYFLVLTLSLIISLGTLDYTRVFTLLTFPALLFLLNKEIIIYNMKKLYAILPMAYISLFQLQLRPDGIIVDSAWSWFWMQNYKEEILNVLNHLINIIS